MVTRKPKKYVPLRMAVLGIDRKEIEEVTASEILSILSLLSSFTSSTFPLLVWKLGKTCPKVIVGTTQVPHNSHPMKEVSALLLEALIETDVIEF